MLADIEKGGTFTSRKRTPKIIDSELRDKIKVHKSNSDDSDYTFSTSFLIILLFIHSGSAKYKNMIKDNNGQNLNNMFGSPGVDSDPSNPSKASLNGFSTDVQSSAKLGFTDVKRPNISDFRNDFIDEPFKSVSRKTIVESLKKIKNKPEEKKIESEVARLFTRLFTQFSKF